MTAGRHTFGATSVGSPVIPAVYPLAGTPSSGSYPAKFPYSAAGTSALNDVTSGCTAQSGYDGPTGRGTPAGVTAFTG